MTGGHQQAGALRPFYRIPLWCACGALVMMALSVSLTHLFMFLTLVSFALEWLFRRGARDFSPRMENGSRAARYVPVAALALFLWLLISSLGHALAAPDPAAVFGRALKSELGDVWIFLFGMCVLFLARDTRGREMLLGALGIFALVLVFSGLAALFSEFRLAKLLTGHGFIASARNRPQHPLALLPGGIRIFQPIGFMNTRLTYGGLLIMILPFLLGRLRERVRDFARARRASNGRGRAALFLTGSGLTFTIALLVLYANRTRSAQLGLLGAAGFALFVFAAWRFTRMEARRRRALLMGVLFVLLAGSGVVALKLDAFSNGVQAFRARNSRFTDAYRPIIWTGSGALIRENPVLGTGPGAYPAATRAWREAYARKHPVIWYFARNAPDGHAHNDILHLAATGGLPAALLFLVLMFLLVRETGKRLARESEMERASPYLFAGLIALFPAGLFQCYFQDDEVVVLFWVLTALALASSMGEDRNANLNPRHPRDEESTSSESA